MKTTTKALAATLTAGVIAVGAIVPAMAQDATETPSTPPTDDTTPWHRFGSSERSAELAAALAEELGLDEATVAAALETVQSQLRTEHEAAFRADFEERLAAAVEAGELTQEQADTLIAAREAGVMPFGGRGRGGPGFGGPGSPGRGFGGRGFGGFGFGDGGPRDDDATQAPDAGTDGSTADPAAFGTST